MRLIKNIYTIIEVAAILLAVNLICSCEENDPKGFNGEDAVYFQTDANNWAITNDSINYSFAGKNVDTAMAKGDGLFWVMPVDKVADQIISAIRKKKSKVYVTKRWHYLAIINKNLPFNLYRLL